MAIPQGRNQRWSLDFVSDTLVDGRRFRVLVVVDDFTRECLTLLVDTSLSGGRVARELDRLMALRGRPAMIVSDNGTEFTSHAMLRWSEKNSVEWHYIGTPPPKTQGGSLQAAERAGVSVFHSQGSSSFRWRGYAPPQFSPPLVDVLPGDVVPTSDLRNHGSGFVGFSRICSFSGVDHRRRRSGPIRTS